MTAVPLNHRDQFRLLTDWPLVTIPMYRMRLNEMSYGKANHKSNH